MKVTSLAVGYPWVSPFIWTQAAENMVNLIRPPDVPTRFIRGMGWCPARRHIDICEQSLELGTSHTLIIGADQVHPEDMIPRLIARIEEDNCDVITAMVPIRGKIPQNQVKAFQPTAWKFKPNMGLRKYRSFDQDSDMMELITPAGGDLQRVDFIGSGCLMFPTEVLERLKKPWWYETYSKEEYNRMATMDTMFVFRLRWEEGLSLWVDTTIRIKHLNIFQIDETYSDRFGDWEECGYGESKV